MFTLLISRNDREPLMQSSHVLSARAGCTSGVGTGSTPSEPLNRGRLLLEDPTLLRRDICLGVVRV